MYLRITVLFISLFCVQDVGSWHGNYPYGLELKSYREYEWIIIIRLHHLNMLIFKDVILKLRLAEKLQEKYKGLLAYELGIITAGILETFRDMLHVYHQYTRLDLWVNETYEVNDITNAYDFIHGGYMEILNDKDMYYAILNNYIARKRQQEHQQREDMKRKYRQDMKQKQKNLKDRKGGRRHDAASDTEYKRQMRIRSWGEKWNYFDPKVEGIDVNIKVDVDEIKKAMQKKKKLK